MKKMISVCPVCNEQLKIKILQCPKCNLEMKNDFELNMFDKLDKEKYKFLLCFLQHRGNLKKVQDELEISYPTAKSRLEELLTELGLVEENYYNMADIIDVENWETSSESVKASEIIKHKLKENGGKAVVRTLKGLPCNIYALSDGVSFESDKLPIKPAYTYEVFDVIVDLLIENCGHARKGNGRNYRLGDKNCDDTTVVGTIAKKYSGKKDGDSVFDPVFVLAAVLEWAGIVHNESGEIILTHAYRSKL